MDYSTNIVIMAFPSHHLWLILSVVLLLSNGWPQISLWTCLMCEAWVWYAVLLVLSPLGGLQWAHKCVSVVQ